MYVNYVNYSDDVKILGPWYDQSRFQYALKAIIKHMLCYKSCKYHLLWT